MVDILRQDSAPPVISSITAQRSSPPWLGQPDARQRYDSAYRRYLRAHRYLGRRELRVLDEIRLRCLDIMIETRTGR